MFKHRPLTRFKPGKTFWVLLIALVTGGTAATLARRYLSEQIENIETRHKTPMVNLVVAKTDLVAGARLSSQTVAVRPVPQDHAHSAAVRPEQFDRIDGQLLQHPLKAGDAVLWSSLEAPRPPTFSARVAPGRRAVTIPVDDINAVAGMLEPGDRVDLLLVLDAQGHKHTLTLLRAVQVLATGQRTEEGQGRNSERRLYTTVTLDTDPQQARNLVLAREVGRLTALLRRPDEPLARPGPAEAAAPLDLAAWLASLAPSPPLPAAVAPDVPVLYGGRAGTGSTGSTGAKAALPPAGLPLQVQWHVGTSDPVNHPNPYSTEPR